jgi:branched-subunit amino acid aminotransferase/4-amino-4-deoxychorismate lyase
VRLTVSQRGDGRWNTQIGSDISIIVREISDSYEPLRVVLSPFRVESRRALSGIKSTSYADYEFAWQDAQARGYDEALLLNSRDEVCEGARSNVFWVRDDVLRTSTTGCGCLPESVVLWCCNGRNKKAFR